MDSKDLIAHVNLNSPQHIQSCEDHCLGVATLAKHFASEFGFGQWGYAMGILHDKGKEKIDFQNYIRKTSGLDTNVPSWNDKSHAYVGALVAQKLFPTLADGITNQIAGHHTGLYDYFDLEPILQKPIPNEVSTDIQLAGLPTDELKHYSGEEVNHLVRMLFSCLVDADYLDTERFMNQESFYLRGTRISMEQLRQMLGLKLDELKKAPDTRVNKIRQQVQDECLKASSLPSGFFSLTVPTGGGKTISSIVWAVNHAIKNDKKRIIIAIPYTSIIVQTAAVLKNIFGEDNVLEHHTNYNYDDSGEHGYKQKLSTENWDYPIIVTTNVQLFESMYSNKPSACRKLHNICNSVLILDEVQTLPTDYLQPIVDVLKCYQKNFGVSVLFTTASQPILSGVIEACNPRGSFLGIDSIHEIIPDNLSLHDRLRRVTIKIDDTGKTYDEIAGRLMQHDCVLCIVNTRRDAKELYNRLPEGGRIHLSRMMCSAHIRQTIEEVNHSLQNKRTPLRVVATQLIEAGVDIDFPVVYRQEAGLDSVLQAAGRCNREGKMETGTTFVFSLSKEHPLPSGAMSRSNDSRKALGVDRDWFAPQTMMDYFKQLYGRTETYDRKDIKTYLYKPDEMCFKTSSDEFVLIDDVSIPVIVNWRKSFEIVERLKTNGLSYGLSKIISQYSVNVRHRDFKKLVDCGAVNEVIEGIYVVENDSFYSQEVGLLTDNQWLEEILIL